jgi:hypothetical protein
MIENTTEGTATSRLSIGATVARAEMTARSAERRRVDERAGDTARVPAERLTPKLIHAATDVPAATARATTRGEQWIDML